MTKLEKYLKEVEKKINRSRLLWGEAQISEASNKEIEVLLAMIKVLAGYIKISNMGNHQWVVAEEHLESLIPSEGE